MGGRRHERRLLAWLVAACLAVAAGVPAAWWLSRPPTAVGDPVSASAPVPTATSPAGEGTGAPAGRGATAQGAAASGSLPRLTARPATPQPQQAVPAPVRLLAPDLGVDAPVLPVGVRPDGAMQIPADGAQVGWYRFGPAPGEREGSAVLAGHVDTRAGGLGALHRLEELEVGAELVVVREDGAPLRYAVTGRERITKAELPVERIFATGGPEVLTVITCGGPFLPEVGAYRDNVVVVAERVGA